MMLQNKVSLPACSRARSTPLPAAKPINRRNSVVVKVQSQAEEPSVIARIGAACSTVALSLVLASSSYAAVAETSPAGSNVGFLSDDEVLLRRDEFNFARAFDGKVALQSPKTKSWWDVKLDLKSPGTLLLRSPQGQVHYLAFSSLQQIDLSDDEVVAAISASNWEQGVVPVQAQDDRNKTVKLELTREGFYQLVSVVEATEPDMAP